MELPNRTTELKVDFKIMAAKAAGERRQQKAPAIKVKGGKG